MGRIDLTPWLDVPPEQRDPLSFAVSLRDRSTLAMVAEALRHGNLALHVALGRTIDGARFRKHGARAVHFPVSNDVGPFGHGYVLQIV